LTYINFFTDSEAFGLFEEKTFRIRINSYLKSGKTLDQTPGNYINLGQKTGRLQALPEAGKNSDLRIHFSDNVLFKDNQG
jgi:hypothetical protein